MNKKRIVVGISGASGVPIAVEVLKGLKAAGAESHLVVSRGGENVMRQETGQEPEEIKALADVVYEAEDLGAAIASGSYPTDGMIVVPCSMKTLAGIHSGYSENLILRAADVTLKERRKLVLVIRESPLSAIHLRNAYELSMMGAIILPPLVCYYHSFKEMEELTRYLGGRILDQFGIFSEAYVRWKDG